MKNNLENGGYQRRQDGSILPPTWPLDMLAGVLAIGGVITLVANLDKNKKGQEFVPTQKTQIEQQVDNKCEGDIFTIGDMKLRIPRGEQFRRLEVPRENPAK